MDIAQYIDIMLIDQYATKSLGEGYSLWLDEISPHDTQNFLDYLHENDPVFKDMVGNYMQEIINKRLVVKEVDDRFDKNLHLVRHSNGNQSIERRYR